MRYNIKQKFLNGNLILNLKNFLIKTEITAKLQPKIVAIQAVFHKSHGASKDLYTFIGRNTIYILWMS